MNTMSDNELKEIFGRSKPIGKDHQFTHRVMSNLPTKERKGSSVLVWTFGIAGLMVALFSGAIFRFLTYFLKFGIELTKAQTPEVSSIVIYLVVLGIVAAASFNLMKRKISLSF